MPMYSFRKINRRLNIVIEEELDRAYLAGLFDGEGSFAIQVNQRRKKKPPGFFPVIRIFMMDEPTIRFVADLLGYTYNKRLTEKGKLIYGIQFRIEKDLEDFITQTLPYLKAKEKQAKLILKFLSLKDPVPTQDALLKEFDIWYEVRKLNPKGRPPTKEYCAKLREKIANFDYDTYKI